MAWRCDDHRIGIVFRNQGAPNAEYVRASAG